MARVTIWHPGEMGSAIGLVLRARDIEVVTCVENRSERTQERARTSGFVVASTLEGSLAGSDLVVSIVWPQAALATAEMFAAACRAGGHRPVYLDANATSPATKLAVAARVADAGCRCIDGALTSTSSRITTAGRILLSGPVDDFVLHLLQELDAKVVGDAVGDAAALNMCRSIFVKGMSAIFLDALSAAATRRAHTELIELLAHLYPGTMAAIERILPTFQRHLARRVEELGEARRWKSELGLRANLVEEIIRSLLSIEEAGLFADRSLTFAELVDELADRPDHWG